VYFQVYAAQKEEGWECRVQEGSITTSVMVPVGLLNLIQPGDETSTIPVQQSDEPSYSTIKPPREALHLLAGIEKIRRYIVVLIKNDTLSIGNVIDKNRRQDVSSCYHLQRSLNE